MANLETLLTVLGIAVSIAMGAWGVVLAIRYSRRVELTYCEESCLSLFADVTQGIDALEVRFRDSPVSKNLVLLRGYIFNSGRRDITPAMVERPLRLALPTDFGWIDCRITNTSKNLRAEVGNLSADAIELKLGLFKTGEYFKFDALFTLPAQDSPAAAGPKDRKRQKAPRVPYFDYRISDAGSIKILDLETPLQPRPPWRRIYIIAVAAIVAGLVMSAATFLMRWNVLAYRISDPVAGVLQVTTRAKGQLVELSAANGYRRLLSTAQFDSLTKTATVAKGPRPPYGIGLAYSGLGLLMLLFYVPELRKRRYRRALRDKVGDKDACHRDVGEAADRHPASGSFGTSGEPTASSRQLAASDRPSRPV